MPKNKNNCGYVRPSYCPFQPATNKFARYVIDTWNPRTYTNEQKRSFKEFVDMSGRDFANGTQLITFAMEPQHWKDENVDFFTVFAMASNAKANWHQHCKRLERKVVERENYYMEQGDLRDMAEEE